jgi:DNA repair protein RadC
MEFIPTTMSNLSLLQVLCGPAIAQSLANRPLNEVFGYSMAPPKDVFASEERLPYPAVPQVLAAKELLTRAMQVQMEGGILVDNPDTLNAYLCSKIGHLGYEVFWCLFLNSKHELISAHELFRGTLTQTSVYPREVVVMAMHANAAAVVFCHNHPSGQTIPSRADELLTQTLKAALGMVDVRVLDHIIVSGTRATSMAQRGLV